ncbi:hypothetical protein O6H91_17G052800 [Diphasiastrum complanatum]|uniref:Uncharacterized protein n=1 Tax=Diphasiastrum complanatum TaxID=34168 RepID=A0ACC2B6T2_DIPCM|nr:hypothetical protein O6H91_17G052800 [Diphasiastrum complanatum]
MEVAANHAHPGVLTVTNEWEQSYKPLPFLFFGLLILWITLLSIWTFNTWSKRRWQTSNLQWVLTTVPVLKSLVVGLSFAFWYSCLNLSMCSFWIAFGVFVTRSFFETSCFVAFLLISHGYCIMHEQLSVADRRSIAGLASVLYIALTGYRAAVPQFAVLVVLIYLVLLYVIFLHVSRNLIFLQEQLQHIQDEGVHIMHTAVHTKYMMFKKFQGVMVIMIVAEVLMHGKANGAANYYWMRSLVHEWTEIGIFVYVGWIFRSRDISPYFSVVPSVHVLSESSLPPIFKLEMNEKDFHGFDLKDWHIGVPTSLEKGEANHLPMVVLVQNPSISSMEFCASQDKLASVKHLAYSPFDVVSEVKESNLVACTGIFRASIRSLVSCEADFNNMSKNKPSRERKIVDGNMAGSRRDDTALFVKEFSDI